MTLALSVPYRLSKLSVEHGYLIGLWKIWGWYVNEISKLRASNLGLTEKASFFAPDTHDAPNIMPAAT